jgi:hypothetical protein
MLEELRKTGVEIEFTGGSSGEEWERRISSICSTNGIVFGRDFAHRKWPSQPQDINLTRDGSVTSPGMELQTRPFYIQEKSFVEKFSTLMIEIARSGGVIDKSCGLHVHISGKDITLSELANLIEFYFSWQDVLMSLVQSSRRNNSYTKKIAITTSHIKAMRDQTKIITLYETLGGIPGLGDRYCILNIVPLRIQRHYEIRLCHGLLNPSRILNWISLNLHIIQYLKKTDKYEYYRKNPNLSSVEELLKLIQFEESTQYFVDEYERFNAINKTEETTDARAYSI